MTAPQGTGVINTPQYSGGSSHAPGHRRRVGSYITGNIGMNLLYESMAVYLLYFYTDVFGITAAAAGTVLLIARIVDIVCDPAIGVLVDRTRSRWGKFRPYLLFGPLPLGLLAVLCFSAPGLGDGMKMFYATVTYSLFSVAYALINVPYASMLPGLSRDYYQRAVITSYKELAGTLAILIVNAGTLYFVHFFGSEAAGFPAVLGGYALVAVFTLAIAFRGTKGVGEEEAAHPPRGERPSFKAQLKTLVGNRPLYRVLVFIFGFTLGWGIHIGAMVYFFKYGLERHDLFPAYQLVSTGVMFVSMFAGPALVRWLGKRGAALFAQTVTIAGLAGLFFLHDGVVWVFFLGSLASAGFGLSRPLVWGMTPDTVEYGEWIAGERAEGVIYSVFIGVQKLGTAATGIVTGAVLSATGFVANTALSPPAMFGVVALVTLVPIVASLLVIAAMGKYRLDEQQVDSIVAELRNRPHPS